MRGGVKQDVFIFDQERTHTFMYNMFIYIYIDRYIYMSTPTYLYIEIYMYVYIHIYIHTYIYICICIHVYTCKTGGEARADLADVRGGVKQDVFIFPQECPERQMAAQG